MAAAKKNRPRNIALPQLDRTHSEPLYLQLAAGFRELIVSGKLSPGERLPPARELARDLGITPITATHAYQHLKQQGLVDSKVGSGTFVCARPGTPPPAPATHPAFINLDKREPDPGLFPSASIRRIMDSILDQEGGDAFSYSDADGYEPLKQEISRRLELGGFETTNRDVVIFSGAQQALNLILRCQIQRGDWVLVERPTYPGIIRLLQHCGARIECIDLGPEGPDPDQLARILKQRPIRLFYTMPVYHNPTGQCWSERNKREIARHCATHNVLLLEDDSLSDLNFGNGLWKPLCACEPSASSTVYIKSFSLILMPGFRLGFCLAPRTLSNSLHTLKEQADLLTSGFFQRVLYRFMVQGNLKQHLQQLEHSCSRQFNTARQDLQELLEPAGFAFSTSQGGPSFWGQLPAGIQPERFFRECHREGVSPGNGLLYSPDQSTANCLSLNFGALPETTWRESLEKIRAAVRRSRA
jgi:DNA-binding transcriptional MocR family regulator